MTSQSSPRSLPALHVYLTRLVEGRLWLQVLIGMGLGLVTGVLIGPEAGLLAPETGLTVGNWLALPGQLFLVTIQMIVVPLVFASIIRGLSSGPDLGSLRRLGLMAAVFFVVSTAIAAGIGIQLALMVEPGSFLPTADRLTGLGDAVDAQPVPPPTLQELPGMVIDLLPGNPLNAMVEGQMLQVVLFAFVIGFALVSLPRDTARPMLDVLGSLQEVCMAVVRWAMTIAPIAVFGLMAQLTSRTGWQTLMGLGVYVFTVVLGLAVVLVLYLICVRVFARRSPRQFLIHARELLLAFSTSSSAAVMPLSIRTAVEKLGVRASTAHFVIPLGATINMNGTALYQAVAAVFLAQVFQVEIGTGGLALIVAMAVGASIGSPATPGVGIVILASILASIGVPAAGVALIIGVDRLLDMSRTAVNASGDLVACLLLDRWAYDEPADPSG